MDEILKIDPRIFEGKTVAEEEILLWFELANAYWVHDGDLQSPHAELISGMCSNGYFDCPRLLKYPNLCEILANQLARKLKENGVQRVDWIIGSAYAAITFSYEVAKAMDAIHGFTEKDPQNPKKMVWRRTNIPEGSIVLQIEELTTTGHTFQEVRQAIEQGNEGKVRFLPTIGVLVHRPPKLPVDYGELRVIALVEKEIWAVNPKDCYLCEAGSPRYRPKTHWPELTGKR